MTVCSYIVGAKRSPIAPRGGGLSRLNLHQLATPVIQALADSVNVDLSKVDELIVGNALGAGGNPARVLGLASGMNESVAGLTIDRQCCSGLDAILVANDMIISGRASIVIAGGVESYSQRPQRFQQSPDSPTPQAYDQPPFTPWPDRDPDMAVAADALATSLNISFEQQNQWAVESHRKALSSASRMAHEIVPMASLNKDNFTRELKMQLCHRAARIQGNVSIANTSVAADGAAFSMVVSEKIAKYLNCPKLRIRSGITLGSNPMLPGLAPVAAIQSVLADTGIDAKQLACVEVMEAYAAQAIACIEQTDIDPLSCNIGGGALARGHPIGASGAVLMTRLFSELQFRQGMGLATIAAAGGLGTAIMVESC